MGKLVTFFRDVKTTLARSPEVKAAVQQVEKQVEAQLVRGLERGIERFVDRFESRVGKPAGITPEQRASNEDFVRGLYRDLLKREPDAGGLAAHMAGLERGVSRADIRNVFLNSSEYQELQRPQPAPTPAPVEPTPAPAPRTWAEPGPALSTVPPKPEYLDVPIDTTSPEAALLSTAKWVRQNRPAYFDNMQDDRGLAKDMMTEVIGILRAHGFDAHRVVNHPSLPPSNPVRWGSDAAVLNGKVYDLYISYGDPTQSVPHLGYAGPYEAGRLRE
ncbi:MAG: DUF4214 domain-containing protein [Archangium sp.]